MDPKLIFIAQLVWFIACWSCIAAFVIWPWSKRLSLRDRLSLFVAPEMFRVLGMGLLVPNLSPGMSVEFAVSTAIGDSLTSVLALSAFVMLRRGAPSGRGLAWAATIVGMADLLVAFPHANATGAIAHMAAQWFVPTVAGPVMVVAHVCCLITLIRERRTPLVLSAPAGVDGR